MPAADDPVEDDRLREDEMMNAVERREKQPDPGLPAAKHPLRNAMRHDVDAAVEREQDRAHRLAVPPD